MTPEEYFERINKTLDRMATEAATRATQMSLEMMELRHIQTKAERGREFLVESHAQLATALIKLSESHTQTNQTVASLATAVSGLVRLFEDHACDGHGGKDKKK